MGGEGRMTFAPPQPTAEDRWTFVPPTPVRRPCCRSRAVPQPQSMTTATHRPTTERRSDRLARTWPVLTGAVAGVGVSSLEVVWGPRLVLVVGAGLVGLVVLSPIAGGVAAAAGVCAVVVWRRASVRRRRVMRTPRESTAV